MPNKATHARLGLAGGAGACVYMASRYKRIASEKELALCAGVGLLAAGLPDILEPALNPRHRSTAHSLIALFLLIAFVCWYCSRDTEEEKQFTTMLGAAAGVGYITHLVADALTPAGLPLYR